MKRNWIMVSILVLMALIAYAGFFIYSNKMYEKQKIDTKTNVRNPENTNIIVKQEPSDTIYKIFPDDSRLFYGKEDAIVKIILFADFSNYRSIEVIKIFKQLIEENADISLYLYSFPIYKNELSLPLSNLFILSLNAGKKSDFEIFINKNVINKEDISDFANKYGIDISRVFHEYREGDLSKLPALNDMNIGVNFGVTVPPVYFINGLRIEGLRSSEEIRHLLIDHLTKAHSLLKSGVKRGDIYKEIVKDGKEVAYRISIQERKEESDNREKISNNMEVPANIYEEDLRYVPYKGARFAPVTMVIFVDYECPYTKRFYISLNAVMKKYENRLRVFIKHYPLSTHKKSSDIAKILASALTQRKFWILFEKIMEEPDFPDEKRIVEIAPSLGIDIRMLLKMRDSEQVKRYVENDVEKGNELGITVLPTSYINGVRYEGVISAAMLEKIIESELKLAEKLKEEGITEESLYDTMVKRNKFKNLLNKGIKKPYIEKIK